MITAPLVRTVPFSLEAHGGVALAPANSVDPAKCQTTTERATSRESITPLLLLLDDRTRAQPSPIHFPLSSPHAAKRTRRSTAPNTHQRAGQVGHDPVVHHLARDKLGHCRRRIDPLPRLTKTDSRSVSTTALLANPTSHLAGTSRARTFPHARSRALPLARTCSRRSGRYTRVRRGTPRTCAAPLTTAADPKDILRKNGVDPYVFVRFLWMLTKIMIPIWGVSWLILFPADAAGATQGKTGLDMFTSGNILNLDRWWAHLWLAYLFNGECDFVRGGGRGEIATPPKSSALTSQAGSCTISGSR